MALTKLSSTDAFVVTDGADPETPATGVVRTGKKILQSSAQDLARRVHPLGPGDGVGVQRAALGHAFGHRE